MSDLTLYDGLALAWYLFAWGMFGWLTDYGLWHRGSLSRLMDQNRRLWMRSLQFRDVRMVDTAIMGSLQNGTSFFTSTSLIALGGTLALLNQSERVLTIFSELPIHVTPSKELLEIKVLGLAAVYGYAFFKFGWAYRLYNYAAILIGAIPPLSISEPDVVRRATERAADMQIHAGHHFHWGLRSLFFSIGYLGWFLGPWVFFATSTLIVAVLTQRQFWSPARRALLD